jgi:aspartyl-tRNA(Asn)/glutamyl-tRNA(Gln) amidotransferase subunit A
VLSGQARLLRKHVEAILLAMQIAEARARCAQFEHLNIFITMTDETGPGEVVAVKDMIDVMRTPTSAGSTVLPMDPKPDDAPLIHSLRGSGCVMIGKTNMDEWALGSTSNNPHYGIVRNPRDVSRIAGGSSGGSAAAVAVGVCDWAIGTDTGGSVRIPAALCGVVGFKPTLGTIDTTGVLPLSCSLDTVGSLAPDVRTATRGAALMAGKDGWDAVSAPALSDLRLAVPGGWVRDLDETVGAVWMSVASQLRLPEIPFPPLSELAKGCLDLMSAEAAAYHRRWVAECPERYGAHALARLRGMYGVSGADYVDAVAGRDPLRADVAEAMDGYDAVLVPTTAAVAPLIQERIDSEPLTRFTRAFNYTGQPVFSLPIMTAGLPVGIQVVGRVGKDAELAPIALTLEQAWSGGQTQP